MTAETNNDLFNEILKHVRTAYAPPTVNGDEPDIPDDILAAVLKRYGESANDGKSRDQNWGKIERWAREEVEYFKQNTQPAHVQHGHNHREHNVSSRGSLFEPDVRAPTQGRALPRTQTTPRPEASTYQHPSQPFLPAQTYPNMYNPFSPHFEAGSSYDSPSAARPPRYERPSMALGSGRDALPSVRHGGTVPARGNYDPRYAGLGDGGGDVNGDSRGGYYGTGTMGTGTWGRR